MKKLSITLMFSLLVATIMYASFPVVNENVNEITTIVEEASSNTMPVADDIDWTLAIVCFFLGSLGIHQFMLGNVGKGVLYLLTLGLCGILPLIDFIRIVMGELKR
tara:strand:- start:76 stop:393 length:318 start_codon:yes stop_codon:yes gene_type:complete